LRLLVAVASGILLSLAYPPADLGPLALVAIAPLLWTWRGARARDAALYGVGFGTAFLIVLMWGVHYLGFVALVPLAIVASLYYAAMGALVTVFAARGIRSPLLTAAIWTLLEGLRVRFPLGGLAWGEIGASLHDIGVARALASWGGVALVTFVVVAANGYVLDAVLATRARRWPSVGLAASGAVALVLVAGIASLTRFEPTATGTLRVAMVQAFDLVDAPPTQLAAEQYATAETFELADQLSGRFDLIIFPESSLDRDPELDPILREQVVALGSDHDAVMLVNARHRTPEGKLYNANLAYDPDGRLQGVYAKQHLVPFGEYVPLRDELSFIGELRQIPYDFDAGEDRRLFRAGGRPFASVICYESAYSGLVSDFVRDGAEAIVVSTSDRSYRRSGIAAQHLALAQMRAAETGRPVLQAAISGISGIVDADGNVRDETELFEQTNVVGRVATTTGETPYLRYGDWLLLLCGLGVVVTAGIAAWRGRVEPTVDSGQEQGQGTE
jgi:apolipoprotein N-acyltransferase